MGNSVSETVIENGIELQRIKYYSQNYLKFEEYCFATNGRMHRKIGPALIQYNRYGKIMAEQYYKYGKIHRTNGPAIIEYFWNGEIKNKYYYIEDNEIKDELQIMLMESGVI